MIQIRRSHERGHADFGWLDSRHSFSFGEYHDPRHMGFGPLRVINEDRVAGGGGFPPHSHRDMEIISYVLEGELEHKDSTGGGSVIRPGDVQRMSAGSGITHSEFNASKTSPVHFLQIWIVPDTRGIAPGYEQKYFADDEKRNTLRLIAARGGREGALTIHRDADVYAGVLEAGAELRHVLKPGRIAWLQVARGAVQVQTSRGAVLQDEVALEQGDGVSIAGEDSLQIAITGAGEIILFDMGADQ